MALRLAISSAYGSGFCCAIAGMALKTVNPNVAMAAARAEPCFIVRIVFFPKVVARVSGSFVLL